MRTFETLATRAGVHKTTLYRRWGTRENLLLDAALHSAADAVPVPDTGALHTDVHELVAAIAANLRSPPAEAMLRAVVAEAMAQPTVADAARRFWQARFAGARDIVNRAINRGEVAPTVDPDLVIEMLIGPVYLRVLVTQEPIDDEFVRSLVGFVVRGTG